MANPENEKRLRTRFLVFIGETIGSLLLKFCYNSNSWEYKNQNHFTDLKKSGKPIIIASWHSTLLSVFMGLAKNNYYGLAGNHHPDAEIISRIGNSLGWNIIRGSSTDGGKKAYDDMLSILHKPGTVFAITPDGPQGPPKIPKAGTIRAAQKTGAAIIPVGGQSTKRWSFKNWDTFYVSKPFSKTTIIFGEPIFFDKNQKFEDCQKILKNALDGLEKKVQNHVGMD